MNLSREIKCDVCPLVTSQHSLVDSLWVNVTLPPTTTASLAVPVLPESSVDAEQHYLSFHSKPPVGGPLCT